VLHLNHQVVIFKVDIFQKLVRVVVAILHEARGCHGLVLLLDHLVVGPQFVSESALNNAAHALQLALQRLQLAVAGSYRLLYKESPKVKSVRNGYSLLLTWFPLCSSTSSSCSEVTDFSC